MNQQPTPAARVKGDRNTHDSSADESRPTEFHEHQSSGGGHRSGSRGAFTPASLRVEQGSIRLGTPVVLACFPLGFYDTTCLLPVARQGSIASSYGVRFQGRGCFLSDARMHRGSGGAPVLMRRSDCHDGGGPWTLSGVHSARMDMGTRDAEQDDMLGLNLAWYADILETLTCTGVTP